MKTKEIGTMKYMVSLAYSRPEYNEFELEYRKSNSIEELQKAVRNFIDENDVMSSEWEGGQVYDLETSQLIGFIAYNGKFFTKEEGRKYGLK